MSEDPVPYTVTNPASVEALRRAIDDYNAAHRRLVSPPITPVAWSESWGLPWLVIHGEFSRRHFVEHIVRSKLSAFETALEAVS